MKFYRIFTSAIVFLLYIGSLFLKHQAVEGSVEYYHFDTASTIYFGIGIILTWLYFGKKSEDDGKH